MAATAPTDLLTSLTELMAEWSVEQILAGIAFVCVAAAEQSGNGTEWRLLAARLRVVEIPPALRGKD